MSAYGAPVKSARRNTSVTPAAGVTRNAAGTAYDVLIPLGEWLPVPAPHGWKPGHWATKADDYSDAFTDGISRASAASFAAQFTPTEAMNALMARMDSLLHVNTTDTRPRRRSHQKWGERVGDAAAYGRWRRDMSQPAQWWERSERAERPHRGIVRVAVNIGVHSGQGTHEAEWSGATALSITDHLEGMGYRVELYALMGLTSHGDTKEGIDLCMTLKGAADRVSNASAAIVSSVGLYRTCVFSWIDSLTYYAAGYGYGSPRDYAGSQSFDVTVPRSITKESDAVAFIEATMTRYTAA